MAYEQTIVSASKSQEAIRRLIMQHGGYGIAFVSDREPGAVAAQEGFHAKVLIEGKPYAVRVMATVKASPDNYTDKKKLAFIEQEERRIWRVLYYHLKSVFEAADSGVMEFRELMLPYMVMNNGQTIAENLIPRIDLALNSNRLLTGGEA